MDAQRFLNGQRIQLDADITGDVCVLSQGILLGTGKLKQGQRRMVLHPLRILPSAQNHFLNHGDKHE